MKRNFVRSMDRTGVEVEDASAQSHQNQLASPKKARKLVSKLAKENSALKVDNKRLEALLASRPVGTVGDEAHDMIQSEEMKKAVDEFFGEGSDSAAVWVAMMDNAKRSAKGGSAKGGSSKKGSKRKGNRYPDVVIRLAVQLLSKVGSRTYEEIAKLFFLPHLRTATHHKYCLFPPI
jgi:regulator of replication initiation timing